MYFALCPGPEGPVILLLLVLAFASVCATVAGLLFVMKLVNDRRKRRVMWSSTPGGAGSILGL